MPWLQIDDHQCYHFRSNLSLFIYEVYGFRRKIDCNIFMRKAKNAKMANAKTHGFRKFHVFIALIVIHKSTSFSCRYIYLGIYIASGQRPAKNAFLSKVISSRSPFLFSSSLSLSLSSSLLSSSSLSHHDMTFNLNHHVSESGSKP